MKLKMRIALLLCLAAAAMYTGAEALRGLQPERDSLLPQEIYSRFAARAETAEYFLKSSGDYVAVFQRPRDRQPLSVTGIELAQLRGADRAMVEAGIPVGDRRELLLLLEDLGS